MVDAGQHEQPGQREQPERWPVPEPGRVPGEGQLPLWCEDSDSSGDMPGLPVLVRPGDAAALVAAFTQAQELATQVWRCLAGCELGGELLSIAASLSESGHPCVVLRFSPAGTRAVSRVLADVLRDPPPGVYWTRHDPAA